MALNNTQVEFILETAQTVAVRIHNCDVVIFTHQVFSQRAANLPRAQNDYLHIS
jgi:hypothetical protein